VNNEAPVSALSLHSLQELQRNFDALEFTGADAEDFSAKRRHIAFHLGILVGKVMRVEELTDHGHSAGDILIREVIPDLLVYASQLANLTGEDLEELYLARLSYVSLRNGERQSRFC